MDHSTTNVIMTPSVCCALLAPQRPLRHLAVAVLLAACTPEPAPRDTAQPRDPAPTWSAAEIDTLLRLGRDDQTERDTLPITAEDTTAGVALMRADSARTRWVRAAVARDGWPVRTAAGDSAMNAAWYILQHSPDTAWQGRALTELEALARQGAVPMQDIALLMDRVFVRRGVPQRYGSQFQEQEGRWVAEPIEDLAGLDARRASMGLPPMSVYVEKLATVTKMPVVWPPTQ